MFEALRNRAATWAGKAIKNLITKGDVNWWVRFLKIAHAEDLADYVQIGDVMKNHAWVNICVSARAKNIARADFQILSGDEPLESGPVYDLFANVNPNLSKYQLWEATESFLWARGECIWIFNDDYSTGVPSEIYPLDPRFFEHVLDKDKRRIVMWKYKVDQIEIPFMVDEIIHFKLWNPWDPFRGVPPATCLAYEVNQDWLAAKSNLNILRHGSIPDGVLTTEQPIDEDEAKRVKVNWNKEHQGADRAHTISVLGHGVKYEPITLTNQDMEYQEMKKWNRSAILGKFGVFPGVIGLKDEASPLSGKDRKEEMGAFWTLSLIPELKFFEDKLETEFFQRFRLTGLKPHFNLDSIPELQEDEGERFTRFSLAADKGLMKINEARERLGFEGPVPWGDTWWKPFSLRDVQEQAEPLFDQDDDIDLPLPKQIGIPSYKLMFPIFAKPKSKTEQLYTDLYKTNHWWKMAKAEDEIEAAYRKALRKWFYNQRSRHLSLIAEHMKSITVKADVPWEEIEEEMLNGHYWGEQIGELRKFSMDYFMLMLGATESDLINLFTDLGLNVSTSFNIYDTSAPGKLPGRLDKISGIVDTIRDQMRDTVKDAIEGGWTERELAAAIRDKYNIAQNRADAIARTELGGVINDSRIDGYKSVGFEWHSWLSARDGSVRDLHMIDGEKVKIGERFSNGLLYPNDPDGEAENVINCRCITLPEEE